MSTQSSKHRDSATTTVAAILHFVLSGLVAIVTVIFLLIVGLASSSRSSTTKDAASVLAVVAFVLLAFAVALIYVGVMFVRHRPWARWTLVVFYALGLLAALSKIGQGGSVPVSLLIDGAMLVLLLVPSTARDFAPKPVMAAGWPAAGPPIGPPMTPAGWYPDPHAPGSQRYWDGTMWTQHTAPGATQPR